MLRPCLLLRLEHLRSQAIYRQRVCMDGQQIDKDIYDDEAFIGVREGEIEGKVLDDLDAEGAVPLVVRGPSVVRVRPTTSAQVVNEA